MVPGRARAAYADATSEPACMPLCKVAIAVYYVQLVPPPSATVRATASVR